MRRLHRRRQRRGDAIQQRVLQHGQLDILKRFKPNATEYTTRVQSGGAPVACATTQYVVTGMLTCWPARICDMRSPAASTLALAVLAASACRQMALMASTARQAAAVVDAELRTHAERPRSVMRAGARHCDSILSAYLRHVMLDPVIQLPRLAVARLTDQDRVPQVQQASCGRNCPRKSQRRPSYVDRDIRQGESGSALAANGASSVMRPRSCQVLEVLQDALSGV